MRTLMSRLAADDRGVALLTVIGVMSMVTILAVGSFAIARQTLHESERVEDESRAFRAASGGLERALSTFVEGDNTTVYPMTGSNVDGAYTVALVDLDAGRYRLDSTGTGADGSTELVSQEFYFVNLWRMNFAGTGPQSLISGSSGLNGTSNVIGPFYMKGTFEIRSNMGVFEGPLFVKGGNISVHSNSWLGSGDQFIDVFCDGSGSPSVPTNRDSGGGRGVYVGKISRSVPDILLPPLTQESLDAWAAKAVQESVNNYQDPYDPESGETPLINLEATGAADTYRTMQPPNNLTTAPFWQRSKATATNDSSLAYKFFGAANGSIQPKGSGATHLTIGGSSFGAWGSLSTADGVSLSAGPAGSSGYPAGRRDDFAYDHVNKILYISGTVFVDGPVTFNENMRYIGNGTIVANGPVTIRGFLRPYSTNTAHGFANAQGENNKWALGIATPDDIWFRGSGSNDYNSMDRESLRNATPTYAGAFYTERIAHFTQNNLMVRGTVLSGKMSFQSSNNYLITNPLLPEYLPDSLPGVEGGIMMPGLWTRN